MGSPALPILSALFMAFWGTLYFQNRKRKKKWPLFFKAAATCIPLGEAFFYCLSDGFQNPVRLGIMVGALFCAAADVLLELHFLSGMTFFALGHVCFLAALLHAVPLSFRHFLFFLLLFAASLLFHGRQLSKTGKPALPIVLYGALLSAMTAAALAALRISPMAAAGALLFYLSDNMICLRLYKPGRSGAFSAFVLIFYYSAVWLLCSSTRFF